MPKDNPDRDQANLIATFGDARLFEKFRRKVQTRWRFSRGPVGGGEVDHDVYAEGPG